MKVLITESNRGRIMWYLKDGDVYVRFRDIPSRLKIDDSIIIINTNDELFQGRLEDVKATEDQCLITLNGKEFDIDQFCIMIKEIS